MGVVEIDGFRKRGEDVGTVTAVSAPSIDDFLGTRTRAERVAHLRRLRDEGILIHNPGRLTQRLRDQGVRRAYVFRGPAWSVPRYERASGRGRVRVASF